jgi:TonB family protein
MRRKELPTIARRLFDDGRAAFKAKDAARAQEQFDLLLQILDDPAMKGRPETDDLRALAEGYVTLATAPALPAAEAEGPGPSAPARIDTIQADTLIEAVALQQAVPVWVPPAGAAGAREYVGSIKVRIGADGRVKSAIIEKATYPSYDAAIVQASRQWIYKPATRNGQAVESEKVVAFQLRPRG